MRIIANLKGISPLVFGHHYEKYANQNGLCVIPPFTFKNMLLEVEHRLDSTIDLSNIKIKPSIVTDDCNNAFIAENVKKLWFSGCICAIGSRKN